MEFRDSRRDPHYRRWPLFVLGGLLLLNVLGCAWFLTFGNEPKAVASQLPAEMLRAKAAGLPLEESELARPPVSGPNAADEYRRLPELKPWPIKGARRPSLTLMAGTPTSRKALEMELMQNKGFLRSARAASQIKLCNFERDLDEQGIGHHELRRMVSAAGLIALEGVLAADMEDWEQARKCFLEAATISRHLSAGNALAGLNRRVSAEESVHQALLLVLRIKGRERKSSDLIRIVLAALRSDFDVDRALQEEFLSSWLSARRPWMIEAYELGVYTDEVEHLEPRAATLKEQAGMTRLLRYWQRVWGLWRTERDLSKLQEKVDALEDEYYEDKTPGYGFSKYMTPETAWLAEALETRRLGEHFVSLTERIVAHRRTTGHYPNKLKQVSASPASDFEYAVSATGFTLRHKKYGSKNSRLWYEHLTRPMLLK